MTVLTQSFRPPGLVTRFTLVALCVGLVVAGGIGVLLEHYLTEFMLTQLESRAGDQVSLALSGRTQPSDFAAPFTDEKRVRLALRLDSFYSGVSPRGSGVIRLHVIAPDGTIVYSDEPSKRGYQIQIDPESPLAAAFQGRPGRRLSALDSPETADLRRWHTAALGVYVPLVLDGQVVAVYEIYQSLAPVAPIRPLVWGAMAGGFTLMWLALLLVVHGADRTLKRNRREREALLQQAVQARAEAEAARKLELLKDEITSVVSHELRTPLASIVGFIELLLYREYPPQQERQFLQLVHAEGLRLTTLINDFLDLQRLESQRTVIQRRPVDVREIIHQAVSAAGPDDACPIRVVTTDHLPMVHADADRIQQVIANLLSNARKYSPNGGEVVVTIEELNEQVRVTVTDQGLGLPSSAISQLFNKFFRVDNSDHRSIKGTGLGLMICRKIIEAHGGRIWAESDGPGQGSTFTFHLPLHEASLASGPSGWDALIVEDDPSFARLLEEQLSRHNIGSFTVSSAEAALETISSLQPRAIIVDLLLPGIQGELLLTELYTRSEPKPPCIVVSMKDLSDEEQAQLCRVGTTAIFRKTPSTAAEVAACLVRLLGEMDTPHSPEGAGDPPGSAAKRPLITAR